MEFEPLKNPFPTTESPVEMAIWIVGIFTAGTIIGLLSEVILKKYGKRLVDKTKWTFDDYILQSISGILLPFSIVLSFIASIYFIPDYKNIHSIFHKIGFAAIAFLVTLVIARFTSKMVRYYCSNTNVKLPTSLLSNLSSSIIFIIGTLVTLQTFGVSIAPILTTLGIGGLAVALALQDTLANLFSGLNILLSKQVRIGDYVKLDSGNEGYIADITWRNTVIRTLRNNLVIIPNSKLAASLITNCSLPEKTTSFQIEIGVSYDSDLEKVELVTIDTIKKVLSSTSGAAVNSTPSLRFHTFANSSINFTVSVHASEYADQYLLKHECVKALHEQYRKENIVIPYPVQTVVIQNDMKNSREQDSLQKVL